MVRLEFDGRPAEIEDLVIAGWTGRDVAALNRHIEELKAIGVQPPSKVPLYYRVAASLLTQAESIQVPGSHLGLGFNPLVLYAIADRLAQPEGAWQPFFRDGVWHPPGLQRPPEAREPEASSATNGSAGSRRQRKKAAGGAR